MYTTAGRAGAAVLTLVLLVAVIGPFLAPYAPSQVLGPPFSGPSPETLLGTDYLGRDTLSRFLSGGRLLLVVGFLSTIAAYIVGSFLGLVAGYRRGPIGTGIVSCVDVFLSLPPIVLALVLIAAMGPSITTMAIAMAAVLMPPIVRVVRVATREVATTEYVEAAVARGDGVLALTLVEILPNIRGVVAADFGIRLTWALILYASLSFLGFGPTPPTADWGLMIAENRDGLLVSPWPVLIPAIAVALTAVSVNLIADSVAQSMGRSVRGHA